MEKSVVKNKRKKKTIIKNSYGICCTRYNYRTKKIEFLLIKKRLTFHYIDFVLKSHFSYRLPQDEDKIITLLDQMTNSEKIDILSLDYNKMWYKIWLIDPDFNHEIVSIKKNYAKSENNIISSKSNEYETVNNEKNTSTYSKDQNESYSKFLEFKKSFEKSYLSDNGKKLKELINRSKDCECIWEIPKGRKSYPQEKELVAAIRELEEETGITSIDYEILDFSPFIISHISSNVKYVNHYYLALMPGPLEKSSSLSWKFRNPSINYNNKLQLTEVSDVAWMDIDKIEIIDSSKRLYNLAYSINKILRKRYKIVKLSNFIVPSPKNRIK